MVISGVADRIADKIKALAYLDAFIPENGQSLFDINIPANTQRFLDNAGVSGGLSVLAPSAAYFGVNAADAATVDALATPFPLGCFTEKLKLSGAYRAVKNISMCTARYCRAKARSAFLRARRCGRLERTRAPLRASRDAGRAGEDGGTPGVDGVVPQAFAARPIRPLWLC